MDTTTDFDGGGGVEIVAGGDPDFQLTLVDPFYSFLGYFLFRLDGAGGRTVSFEIANLDETRMPADHALYVATGLDSLDWARLDEPVGDSFEVAVPRGEAQVYLSNYPAYPYSRTVERVHELSRHDVVDTEEIGRSHEGRPMYATRISSSEDHDGESRHVGCLTRQHPGEVHGSWHMDATIDYVLAAMQSGDPPWTGDVTFHFIPHANPDGMVAGLHRHTPDGTDLNRRWNRETPAEIGVIKKYFRPLEGDIAWFVDFHATTNESFSAVECYEPAIGDDAQRTVEAIGDHSRSLAGVGGKTATDRSHGFVGDELGAPGCVTEALTYYPYTLGELEAEAVGWIEEILTAIDTVEAVGRGAT